MKERTNGLALVVTPRTTRKFLRQMHAVYSQSRHPVLGYAINGEKFMLISNRSIEVENFAEQSVDVRTVCRVKERLDCSASERKPANENC
jgi:hypothetical protein